MHFCLLSSYKNRHTQLNTSLKFLDSFVSRVKGIIQRMHHHEHHLPCLHCHPHGYIRMVQQLIERCLLLRMSRDGCVRALAERASIQPLITLTVWKELMKENRGFFQAYLRDISQKPHAYNLLRRESRFRRRYWK